MTVHRIADGKQAALLLDADLRVLLGLLMRDARSAGEVARHLAVSLPRASYLLGKLLRADVAFVERVEQRAGRPVRRYRVPGRWFIPYQVTSAETLEALLLAQITPRMDRMAVFGAAQLRAQQPNWGLWLSGAEEYGSLEIGDETGPATALFESEAPIMFTIASSRLSRMQAEELKRRMLRLVEECSAWTGADEEASEYTFSLMLVKGGVA